MKPKPSSRMPSRTRFAPSRHATAPLAAAGGGLSDAGAAGPEATGASAAADRSGTAGRRLRLRDSVLVTFSDSAGQALPASPLTL